MNPERAVLLSVVIPTWNGADRIGRTLVSLAAQTLPPSQYEVVVVDDGSTDRTAHTVAAFARGNPRLDVTCVRIEHGGVNAARNAGVLKSVGAAVVFLDDDEEAPPQHLERLAHLVATTDWPGVGGPCKLVGAKRHRTCSECSIGEVTLGLTGMSTTRRLLGGNMTIRREVFDEVGLFDPEISGRGDETEWFLRADRDFLHDDDVFIFHRRDHMSTFQLLRAGFRQGGSVPLMQSKVGDQWSPSVARIVRPLLHAGRRRCVNGLLQTSREAGSVVGWGQMALSRRKVAR